MGFPAKDDPFAMVFINHAYDAMAKEEFCAVGDLRQAELDVACRCVGHKHWPLNFDERWWLNDLYEPPEVALLVA